MVVLGFVRGMLLASIATAWVQPPPVACNASLRTQQQAPELTEALTRCFPGADSFTTRVATLDDAQRADLTPHLRLRQAPRLWSYTEASQSGALLGRAIAGDVIGKSLPITYLVLLNTDNRVRGVEILNYRESHGGEVRREKWRAQFDGKDATATLKIGSDIKNIAGATLSCQALTDSVHDVLTIAAVVFAAPEEPVASASTPPTARCVTSSVAGCFDRVQLLMGTLLELRCVSADRAAFDAAANSAFARVAELEGRWSSWRADSEVSRLNTAQPGVWCPLSPPTLTLLMRAKHFREASAGAFAVEIGPLVELWRAARGSQHEPSPEQIAAARAAATDAAFEFDFEQQRARRTNASARLDFGAIGKGFALDEVAREFRARGLMRSLFDFGGQLLALDGPRESAGWPVEIRDPRPDSKAALWELELTNASISTSADDQRGLMIDGKLYSHIVDPSTGRPANFHWAACALAANATDADAASTAAFVLEHAASESFATQVGVRLLTLERDGGVWTSASFPGHRSGP